MTTPPARFSNVFVLGLAHCGSTLLGRLLDMHSRVLCMGELMRTREALDGELPCGCGQSLRECSFWAENLPPVLARKQGDYRAFDARLFEELRERNGVDVVVDLSKTRVWRLTRRRKDPRSGYVLLVRDTRGLLSSSVRAGRDWRHTLRRHVKWMKRLVRYAERRGEQALVMHYEDLCLEPERELRRLCAFLGLEFEPDLLRPADRTHHFVHSSASGYLKGSNAIRLDERWRRELAPEELEVIEAAMKRIPLMADRYLTAAGSERR